MTWDDIIQLVQKIELKKQKGVIKMAFDYSKLKGKIVEVFNTQICFADAMGWSERTLSLKMNGIRAWKQPDICKAISLLKLTTEDIPAYFFTLKVQNIEQIKNEGEIK